MKKGILFIIIILLTSMAFAISPDEAITFVSTANNFLLSGEVAGIQEPRVMIASEKSDYWVVAVLKDNTVNVYIPLNNETSRVEEGDVTLRKLIETNITITKIIQLKNSSYGLNWPFSYTTRSTFDTLANDLLGMVPRVVVVQTEMKKLGTSESRKLELLADDTQALIEELSLKSKSIAEEIDKARAYEEKYLLQPDTNQTKKYKDYFYEHYDDIEEYRTKFTKIETNLNNLKQGIATLQTTSLTQTDKDGLINYLKLPLTTAKLPSFFSQANQTKTAIESVFNSTTNIESLVLNLKTRILRNDTWKIIYGNNTKINKTNNNFYSISEAAKAILDEQNASYWIEQDGVSALKVNWQQTETRYNNQEYEKAKEYAKKAESNIISIFEKGMPAVEDNTNDLLFQIIIVLAVLGVGLFIFENYVKKKKKAEEYEQP